MKRNDSIKDYFLTLMQYVINAIDDDNCNKLMFHDAGSLSAFKEKLNYYSELK